MAIMSEVALLLLSAPSSSATSERVVSASGRMDTRFRRHMHPHTLEKLTVIEFFLRKATQEELSYFWMFFENLLRGEISWYSAII